MTGDHDSHCIRCERPSSECVCQAMQSQRGQALKRRLRKRLEALLDLADSYVLLSEAEAKSLGDAIARATANPRSVSKLEAELEKFGAFAARIEADLEVLEDEAERLLAEASRFTETPS